jgi:hypothetical protein
MKMQQTITQILKAGILYFALVFGAGFVFGTVRTLWVVPRVGTRMAELMEMPIMLVVTIVTARWVVLHFAIPSVPSLRLGMGGIALGLLLVAEFGLVLWLRGLSIRQYLATRDPVSGTVYYVMLVVFAIMPLFATPLHGRSAGIDSLTSQFPPHDELTRLAHDLVPALRAVLRT